MFETKKQRTANKALPKAGLNTSTSSARAFRLDICVPIAIGILRLNFCTENPGFHQYQNR
jgi:hypothetical protein